jgi:hypothetical protein
MQICVVTSGSVQLIMKNTSSEESNSPRASPPRITITDYSQDVKDCILQIKAATLSERLVRLNVRRKYIWSDFKESRSNGKVSPTDNVKIVFIGESAIDDGGPRREFFSGMHFFTVLYMRCFIGFSTVMCIMLSLFILCL